MTTPDPFADLRDLYPHLTDAELQEAKETLDVYLEIVGRIVERRARGDFDTNSSSPLR